MSEEKMRASFEAWVRKDKSFYWRWLDRIDGDPEYCAGDIQRLWEAWQVAQQEREAGAVDAQNIPLNAIGRILSEVMEIAISNGANSVSMPDHCVKVAAWLSNIKTYTPAIETEAVVIDPRASELADKIKAIASKEVIDGTDKHKLLESALSLRMLFHRKISAPPSSPQQESEVGAKNDSMATALLYHLEREAFGQGISPQLAADIRKHLNAMKPVYLAPPSAQAIETAAIMRAAEALDYILEGSADESSKVWAKLGKDRILALIPQDGRTQLEEFGIRLGVELNAVIGLHGTQSMEDLRAIVRSVPPLDSDR